MAVEFAKIASNLFISLKFAPRSGGAYNKKQLGGVCYQLSVVCEHVR